jgi:dihydroorotate dehydrogenase
MSAYEWALRPILFAIAPASAHAVSLAALAPLERSPALRALVRRTVSASVDERIVVRTMGLTFPSPVGLAAGFDKNGHRALALSALGFGHIELGTVTAQAQRENPRPNMFRLPADRALINRLGFPNDGARTVAARIGAVRGLVPVPLGVSIGKSRAVPVSDLKAVIADYAASFDCVRGVADFVVVNVSSPNTVGLRTMQARRHVHELLSTLRSRSENAVKLLVKIAPDLNDEDLEDLLSAVIETGIAGVVATNTTIGRVGLVTDAARVLAMGAGGLSGAPLRSRTTCVVRRVRARLGREAVVIGVGGVESAEHAVALIRAGANLVQMYTGFIYGGPFVPAQISREIASIVERSGAGHIGELVGREGV